MPSPFAIKKNKNKVALPDGFTKMEDWILAFDTQAHAAVLIDLEGTIRYTNHTAAHNLGEDVVGKKWAQVIQNAVPFLGDPSQTINTGFPLQRALAGITVGSEVWSVSFSGKEPVTLVISAAPQFEKGQVKGASLSWSDISDQAMRFENIQTNEIWLRQFINAVPEAMYLLDARGVILICNQAGASALGSSLDNAIGQSLFDRMPAEVAANQKRKLDGVLKTGRPARFEEQAGGQFYDQFMYPILDQDRNVIQIALFVLNMTVYRKLELDLRKSEERYRNLVESTSDVVIQLDAHYRFLYASPIIEQSLQYRPEDLIGQEFNRYLHPEDLMEVIAFLEKCGPATTRIEFRMLDKRKKSHTISGAFRVAGNHTTPPSISGILTDITEKRQAEAEHRYREERFRSLIEKTMDIILIVNMKGKIEYASPSVEYVLGYLPEEVTGKLAIAYIHKEDIAKVMQAVKYGLYTADFGRFIEFRVHTKDGKHRIIEAIGRNLVENPAVAGVVINARDITERRIAEDKLWYLSTHDAMTDLYNRAYFSEEMARIERGRNYPISIFMTDVDGLKEVNDDLGHSAGDELLRLTAQLLRNSFRSEDVVARIGGDEFAVLLPGADEEAAQTAMARVRRNLQAINDQQSELRLSLSFGVATGNKGSQLEEVLRKADENMYAEKLSKLGRKARGTGPLSGQSLLPKTLD